jgi:hypothetical protein
LEVRSQGKAVSVSRLDKDVVEFKTTSGAAYTLTGAK